MTVFILGAGVMQVPAIDAAHELGWTVAAADGNAQAPGARLCELFFPVDLKDLEGLLAAARRTRAERGLDAVFTAGTDFSANVARLAASLGLPGHAPEAALAASDKLLMRARFEAAGLPSPRFVEVSSTADGGGAVELLGLPLVVKPADNMGARGCRLVGNRAELSAALDVALPLSRTGRAIVEEYVEGPEYSIDALVYDGGIRLRGFADRLIHFSPYFVELGHTIPSSASRDRSEEILAVFEAGVRSLGLSHGAAKGDMKWSLGRGGPVIGEIAARLSGGYMSGWTYPYCSGIDLTRDALLLAAGLRPEPEPRDRGWSSAERAWISIPGRAKSTLGLRAALAAPGIKDLFQRVAPGDELVFPSNNVEKCGNLISQAADGLSAAGAAETALRGILVRLEAPNPRTEAFLRGEGRLGGAEASLWPPEAFSLPSALATAIGDLPDHLGTAQAPSADSGEPLLVLELPGAAACASRDWSGRSFSESASLALSLGGAVLTGAGTGSFLLAGRFWRALARGGAQAGLYVLDAARRAREAT